MLYRIAHILRDRMPWLWNTLGVILSWLFGLRYGRRLKRVPLILAQYSDSDFTFSPLSDATIPALARMLASQPDEAFTYFRPHGFTQPALRQLVADRGFLAYVMMQGNEVVGYCFQRSYFWGKAYRGYITSIEWRRRGINRRMNQCLNAISRMLGLRVYGTIAPKNVASMRSAQAAGAVRIIKMLAGGDYYVEYLSS